MREEVKEAGVITITERAKEELREVLIAAEAEPYEGLRLLPTSEGVFGLMLDTEMSGDLVIEYEGYKVLLIGLEYFKFLNGKTLDCSDTDVGTILFVH
jgi:Fe-S cluster assembly iron-binding protein IscA